MAFEIPGRKITRVAGADLTAHQYYLVKLHTDGTVIPITAATDIPFGILQNNPDTGEEAEIMKDGVSKMYADEAVAIGNAIGASADGQGQVIAAGTDPTVYMVGIALSATGNAAEQFSVDFSCSAPGRAT